MPQFFNNVAISGTNTITGTATTPTGGTPGTQPGLSVTTWQRQGPPAGVKSGLFKYLKTGTGNFTLNVVDADNGGNVTSVAVSTATSATGNTEVALPWGYSFQVPGSTIVGTSTLSAWMEE